MNSIYDVLSVIFGPIYNTGFSEEPLCRRRAHRNVSLEVCEVRLCAIVVLAVLYDLLFRTSCIFGVESEEDWS